MVSPDRTGAVIADVCLVSDRKQFGLRNTIHPIGEEGAASSVCVIICDLTVTHYLSLVLIIER